MVWSTDLSSSGVDIFTTVTHKRLRLRCIKQCIPRTMLLLSFLLRILNVDTKKIGTARVSFDVSLTSMDRS